MIFLWILYTNSHTWICTISANFLFMGQFSIFNITHTYFSYCNDAMFFPIVFTYFEFFCQIWLNFVDESTIKRSIFNIAHTYFSCCGSAMFFPIVLFRHLSFLEFLPDLVRFCWWVKNEKINFQHRTYLFLLLRCCHVFPDCFFRHLSSHSSFIVAQNLSFLRLTPNSSSPSTFFAATKKAKVAAEHKQRTRTVADTKMVYSNHLLQCFNGVTMSRITTFSKTTRRKVAQHNDTEHNHTQHNDTQYHDTENFDIQYNDTQHNDTEGNDTQYNDIQHNDT